MLTESCVMFFCRPEPFKAFHPSNIFREKRSWSLKVAFSTWSVQDSRQKEFEECESIRIYQSARVDRWQFKSPTVNTHWLVDSNGLAFFKFLWLRILHQSRWESYFWVFRIAFLGKYWKDQALIRHRYEEISTRRLDAGVFEVRILMVWRQF